VNDLRTVSGIVEKYAEFKDQISEIDITSREPDIIKARIIEAKMGLVVEIGDTFSWFCAVINKLNAIMDTILEKPENKLPHLESVLISDYMKDGSPVCPSCDTNPCNCVFFS